MPDTATHARLRTSPQRARPATREPPRARQAGLARHGAATLLLVGVLSASPLMANRAVLVGGGYDPHGSQGQIELNVNWVRDILDSRGLSPDIFYTDGDAAGADVHFEVSEDTPASPLEPLARVFGDLALERRRYREHVIPDVSGGTRRDALEPALAALLARTATEPVLLVYNGHGSQSPASPADVTLNLWDRTTLTARELHSLLDAHRADAAASGAPFRFVMTQCYSGGFHRLAYADPDHGLALTDAPRCGFTAESAYRLAEGCSAGIDIGDYRDYTTFFFAALDGRERDGTPLERDPDSDADGTVTLREAHLHTLEQARSTDLSRATSEDWLERWQPWYLRWLPQPAEPPDNEYARLARRLAADLDVPLRGRAGQTLRARLDERLRRAHALREAHAALHERLHGAQATLQRRATDRWPALLGPYTSHYRELAIDGTLERVAAWLSEQPDYADLLANQRRDAELDAERLAVERDEAQIRKLLRLRRLATLRGQLDTHGSERERADYAALLDCEEQPLVIGRGDDTDRPGALAPAAAIGD